MLKQQPANGMGHLGYGDALKGLGRMQEAIDAYSQVIDEESESDLMLGTRLPSSACTIQHEQYHTQPNRHTRQ